MWCLLHQDWTIYNHASTQKYYDCFVKLFLSVLRYLYNLGVCFFFTLRNQRHPLLPSLYQEMRLLDTHLILESLENSNLKLFVSLLVLFNGSEKMTSYMYWRSRQVKNQSIPFFPCHLLAFLLHSLPSSF